MSKVVGIDLGTTFSAIAHVNEYGKPEIIPNAESERITPSVILFDEDLVVVGETAKENAIAEPELIVEFVKREMGKSKAEYFRSFDGPVGALCKEYGPAELSALILKKLTQDAEGYLGEKITDAVITVPAYFHDAEREATRNAGIIAELNVLQVLNEPTAAALAYGIDQLGSDQNVFVFDLGGGTFDVTVMKVSESAIQMIATNGDHRLGGKDWDDKIIRYVADLFQVEHGEDPLRDLRAYQDLQNRVVDAKKALSRRPRTSIVCQYDGKSTRVDLTREKFEELTADLLEKCRSLCEVVLAEAKMTWDHIDTVLLVGGSTRMPMVREMLAEISGKEINPMEVNPDEVVALGAAIQGTLRQISEGAAAELPDAVVDRFIGADGEAKVTVTDGATHNLGLVIRNAQDDEIVHVMIPKMTTVPCEMADEFGTVRANQSSVLIRVVQGLEQDQQETDGITFEEHKLGECLLGLPSGLPRGARIDVTYKYNLDQTLEVTAQGPDGRVAKATIERRTLDVEAVAQAAKNLQTLEVE